MKLPINITIIVCVIFILYNNSLKIILYRKLMDTIIDLENQQLNERRLATIEASINRTLLFDGEKNKTSYKCSSNCLIILFVVPVIIIIVLVLIIVLKSIKI
jgi:hypothetical protein